MTAALWNGTASHALDYDDTVLALPGHVTAPLLPGLLALAETRRASGRELLTAFVLGVEVMCRVSRALAPGHYRAGWHATATLGRLGGAAACARLLGLDASGVDHAVGFAAAQMGGIQESFGTMGKPFQVGRAAADGLLAAMLAAQGGAGPTSILDRPAWARRLSPDWAPSRLSEGLGHDWAVNEVFFKRFPCCFATHAALTALLDLAPRLDPAAIEAVDLDVCRDDLAGRRPAPARHGPRREVQHRPTAPRARSCAATSGRSTSPARRCGMRRFARWRIASVFFPRPTSTRRGPGRSFVSGTDRPWSRWAIFASTGIPSGSGGSSA